MKARAPNGCVLLFSSAASSVGLPKAGSFESALHNTGELVSERRSGDCCDAGLTVQQLGGGGVSESDPPEVDRRRLPEGDVPIANCTVGGDMELISQLLVR